MKTDTNLTNCLSFEQLHAYTTYKTNKVEREQLYIHISSCELCASAVNGFSVMPFSFQDLTNIHHVIDVKTNARNARPVTFTHVSIIIVSLISIFGFYKSIDTLSENKTEAILVEKVQSPAPPSISKMEIATSIVENNTVEFEKVERKNNLAKNNLLPNTLLSIKEIESIPVDVKEIC